MSMVNSKNTCQTTDVRQTLRMMYQAEHHTQYDGQFLVASSLMMADGISCISDGMLLTGSRVLRLKTMACNRNSMTRKHVIGTTRLTTVFCQLRAGYMYSEPEGLGTSSASLIARRAFLCLRNGTETWRPSVAINNQQIQCPSVCKHICGQTQHTGGQASHHEQPTIRMRLYLRSTFGVRPPFGRVGGG